jgi:ribonuclease HI
MPYYLCSTGPSAQEAELCTSWGKAKERSQGVRGGWAKRFDAKPEADAALLRLRSLRADAEAEELQDVYVDGSAVLGRWSACAVFFGEGDPRNEVRELGPPHTAPRAELEAVLLALERGADGARLWSDSAFVCQAFETDWTSAAHAALARRVRELCAARRIFVRKVAGHSGDPGNTAVDAMLAERRALRFFRNPSSPRP